MLMEGFESEKQENDEDGRMECYKRVQGKD